MFSKITHLLAYFRIFQQNMGDCAPGWQKKTIHLSHKHIPWSCLETKANAMSLDISFESIKNLFSVSWNGKNMFTDHMSIDKTKNTLLIMLSQFWKCMNQHQVFYSTDVEDVFATRLVHSSPFVLLRAQSAATLRWFSSASSALMESSNPTPHRWDTHHIKFLKPSSTFLPKILLGNNFWSCESLGFRHTGIQVLQNTLIWWKFYLQTVSSWIEIWSNCNKKSFVIVHLNSQLFYPYSRDLLYFHVIMTSQVHDEIVRKTNVSSNQSSLQNLYSSTLSNDDYLKPNNSQLQKWFSSHINQVMLQGVSTFD